MEVLSRASQLDTNVWIGSNGDLPCPEADLPQAYWTDPRVAPWTNPNNYAICVEVHEMGEVPTVDKLAGAKQYLDSLQRAYFPHGVSDPMKHPTMQHATQRPNLQNTFSTQNSDFDHHSGHQSEIERANLCCPSPDLTTADDSHSAPRSTPGKAAPMGAGCSSSSACGGSGSLGLSLGPKGWTSTSPCTTHAVVSTEAFSPPAARATSSNQHAPTSDSSSSPPSSSPSPSRQPSFGDSSCSRSAEARRGETGRRGPTTITGFTEHPEATVQPDVPATPTVSVPLASIVLMECGVTPSDRYLREPGVAHHYADQMIDLAIWIKQQSDPAAYPGLLGTGYTLRRGSDPSSDLSSDSGWEHEHGYHPRLDGNQQVPLPRKVLLHCADGYTETSVLALTYVMYTHPGMRLPQAYLFLQNKLQRSFFVYPRELPALQLIEARLLRAFFYMGLVQPHGKPFDPTPDPQHVLQPAAASLSMPENETTESYSPNKTKSCPSKSRKQHHHEHQGLSKAPAQAYVSSAGTEPPLTPLSSLSASFPAVLGDEEVVRQYPWFYNSLWEGSFPSRILDFIYLGNLNHAMNAGMLRALGITHVVSVGESALDMPPASFTPAATAGKEACPSPLSSQSKVPHSSSQRRKDSHASLHGRKWAPSASSTTSSSPSASASVLRAGLSHHASGSTTMSRNSLWAEREAGRISVLHLPNVADDGIDPLRSTMKQAVEFMDQARRTGGKVLVHCRVGVSRSSTIVLAYVMAHLGVSLVQAYLLVRSRRLNILIQPHLLFFWELRGWEAYLVRQARVRAAGKAKVHAHAQNDIQSAHVAEGSVGLAGPFLASREGCHDTSGCRSGDSSHIPLKALRESQQYRRQIRSVPHHASSVPDTAFASGLPFAHMSHHDSGVPGLDGGHESGTGTFGQKGEKGGILLARPSASGMSGPVVWEEVYDMASDEEEDHLDCELGIGHALVRPGLPAPAPGTLLSSSTASSLSSSLLVTPSSSASASASASASSAGGNLSSPFSHSPPQLGSATDRPVDAPLQGEPGVGGNSEKPALDGTPLQTSSPFSFAASATGGVGREKMLGSCALRLTWGSFAQEVAHLNERYFV